MILPSRHPSIRIRRAWVNQPSNLQAHHAHHGKPCIAVCDLELSPLAFDVYFTEGDVVVTTMPLTALSFKPKHGGIV